MNILNFRNIENIRCCGYSNNTLPRYIVSVEIEFPHAWERVEYVADSNDCESMGLLIWEKVNELLSQDVFCLSYEDYQHNAQNEAYINHNERMKYCRMDAYTRETDPLIGQVQRGEISQEDYIMACNNIKTRFPYLEEMTLEQKQAMYPLLNLTA